MTKKQNNLFIKNISTTKYHAYRGDREIDVIFAGLNNKITTLTIATLNRQNDEKDYYPWHVVASHGSGDGADKPPTGICHHEQRGYHQRCHRLPHQ